MNHQLPPPDKPLDVILAQLSAYKSSFLKHPFFEAARNNRLAKSILLEFAFHQYSDSILWVPMLSLMRSKITAPRLLQAVSENIQHETGLHGRSHIDLARRMLRSLEVRKLDSFPVSTFQNSATLWISDEFESFSEPEIAGWLLTAETLVPMMFSEMLSTFEKIRNIDSDYFREHVSVDGDEHSVWMRESAEEILARNPKSLPEILEGMRDAYAETLEVPNALFDHQVSL